MLTVSCCAAGKRNDQKTQKNDKAKNYDQRYTTLQVR